MNLKKLPALVLATAIQILPMCRVACVNQAVAPTGFAIIMRWCAGAVALLGSYHAVSGASAAISGVAAWTKITNGVAAGPVCPPATATGTVGQPLLYKVILSNPGTQNTQLDYYNYDVLPPGLTMTTNVGGTDGIGNEFITGTPTQAGTWTVNLVAGNLNWPQTVTKAFSMTISGGGTTRPGITTPPANQTVTAGANVSFSVTATGTAPLSYLWKFNSTAIAGATTSSLQLMNVQTTNSGTYSVTITNSAGSTNASATLTVNAAATAPTISQQPLSLTVSNGASADFSVTAGGSAPLGYLWRKDGNGLAGATTSAYHLASVTTNDAGAYTVVITNSAGSITSDVATLTVLLPPSILTPPQNTTVSSGNTATFTVAASGSPPLTYQWKFNGTNIASATTTSLSITNAQVANQGDYTVVVSNAVAAITSAPGHLTVQAAQTGPFQIGNWQIAAGSVSFDITGPSQTNIVIWSSTDLSHWTAVSTNSSGTGTAHFSAGKVTGSVEFYRATLSP
ncbi:MAG TPA: immunoglobulin domain-containing protein [Verrucomicrobiae bacterium]|nr:immunoglobulin domain-containing protein [Verrucomicrobiae bacterium]